jgi:hypothetical protein
MTFRNWSKENGRRISSLHPPEYFESVSKKPFEKALKGRNTIAYGTRHRVRVVFIHQSPARAR